MSTSFSNLKPPPLASSFSDSDRYFLSSSADRITILHYVILFFSAERDKIFLAFSQLKRDSHHQGFMSRECGAKVELNFAFHDLREMNLVIDYGNSAAKAGVFEGHHMKEKFVFTSPEEARAFIQASPAEHVIVSSVSRDAEEVCSWATQARRKFILQHSLPLPIANRYATPATLGVDRLAGACGARQMFPDSNCLVIDAGTCITYDFLDAGGSYLGGGISPGLNMRFQAVHTFTKKLPLVQAVDRIDLIGNSTEQCIQSGVIHGVLEELQGIMRQYREKFEDLKVILCGGDTHFFENQLKASIFAVPELVLNGLNSILIYNVNL